MLIQSKEYWKENSEYLVLSSIRGLENSSKLSAITVKVLAVERKLVAKIYENKVKNSILIK